MILIEIIVNKFRLTSLSFFFCFFNENYLFLFKLVNTFKEKNNDKYLHVNLERKWVVLFLSKKNVGSFVLFMSG